MWIKDLGNVKGETGNIYIPKLEIEQDTGMLKFTWEEKTPQEAANSIAKGQKIPIPVYIPDSTTNDGYITFNVSQAVKDTYGEYTFPEQRHYAKGEAGGTTTILQIKDFTGNIEEYFTSQETEPEQNVFYIERNAANPKVYIYNGSRFILLEGFDLNNYCTKENTKQYVESKFAEVNSQIELAHKLLDIEEIFIADEENEDFEEEESDDS